MARILRTLKADDFERRGLSCSRRRADTGELAGADRRTHSTPCPIHSGKDACHGDGGL